MSLDELLLGRGSAHVMQLLVSGQFAFINFINLLILLLVIRVRLVKSEIIDFVVVPKLTYSVDLVHVEFAVDVVGVRAGSAVVNVSLVFLLLL